VTLNVKSLIVTRITVHSAVYCHLDLCCTNIDTVVDCWNVVWIISF